MINKALLYCTVVLYSGGDVFQSHATRNNDDDDVVATAAAAAAAAADDDDEYDDHDDNDLSSSKFRKERASIHLLGMRQTTN